MKCLILIILFLTFTHAEKIIFSYWGAWNIDRKNNTFTIDDVDPTLCTHIGYAFIGFNANGSWISTQPNVDFGTTNYLNRIQELRFQNPSIKLMASFRAESAIFKQISASSELRKNLANSTLQFINEYNFDGIDINWEFPDAVDKDNFVSLIEELSILMRQNNKIFSVAVASDETRANQIYNISLIAQYADFINLMTYEFHGGAWESTTALHSQLYAGNDEPSSYYRTLSVAACVDYWIRNGCPSEKLVIGIPLYGQSYLLASANQTAVQSPSIGPGTSATFSLPTNIIQYNEICFDLKNNGWTREFDNVRKSPYAYKADQWVGYDDAESISAKIDFVFEKNLGGVMFWANDKDDFGDICGEGKNPMQTLAYRKLIDIETTTITSLSTISINATTVGVDNTTISISNTTIDALTTVNNVNTTTTVSDATSTISINDVTTNSSDSSTPHSETTTTTPDSAAKHFQNYQILIVSFILYFLSSNLL